MISRIFRHLDCSDPKKHSICNKAKESEKAGVEKRKLVSTGSARELKLNCRSKAKPKLNMKDIRKCHHPCMEQSLALREGLSQPYTFVVFILTPDEHFVLPESSEYDLRQRNLAEWILLKKKEPIKFEKRWIGFNTVANETVYVFPDEKGKTILTLCMLGRCFMRCCRLLTFFKITFSRKIKFNHYQSVKWVRIQIRTDVLSVPFWIQTVCKVRQHMANGACCKEKVIIEAQ